MSIDCKHNRTMLLQGHTGTGGRESVYVCKDCGRFQIHAEKDGVRFDTSFSLYSNAALIAASQSVARQDGEDLQEKLYRRVWKPLDLAHLRLYEVHLDWRLKSGKEGRQIYIVAADSPNQTPNSAANQIYKLYVDTYNSNPEMADWHVYGYPLQVLQPLEWTENGIALFNHRLINAVRKFQATDPAENAREWNEADEEMRRLVLAEDEK